MKNSSKAENFPKGLLLQNVSSYQMKLILDYMSMCEAGNQDQVTLPIDLIKLLQLYSLSDYFQMESLQKCIVKKLNTITHFERFTSVRRYITIYIEQMSFKMVEIMFEDMPADILVFMLTDPTLVHYFPDLSIFKPLLVKHYK